MTSKRTSAILTPRLLKLNIKHFRSSGLTWAVVHNKLVRAKEFLKSGAKERINKQVIDVPYPPAPVGEFSEYRDVCKPTGKVDRPLRMAVLWEHENMVKLLLENGADPVVDTYYPGSCVVEMAI
ncbi:hypothetical protein BDW74DRAFT_181015 [Aspergillus multicolor]|uniref:uncharacterized protein n=1 Tax=Aspergillus multicolor TaxID=41759 RepID=UPI003CCCA9BF